MKIVSITQARNDFADLINQVSYTSQQIIIQKMGKPVAALVNIKELNMPVKNAQSTQPPSATAGTISISHKINMEKVFRVIKEPYDRQSLLGR
ncbi:hypothetical protein A2960_06260 [Candidatus Gottesmanbacteria bacterium RIFCSPLOWO2_01_FULL_39_12b]|uniref:Antitoxin n=1 Tax=Candidatus Gottesmanbacteria bacterium RIFCSPLOWO2_01_FULL_39_12b TaxID=1798388 RepID=A0A1F6APM6_9BACT|nr:MAG: hypothetical protein A2960_06260 [Candidatus Gottesmanbacteria bacterium RIFCSPLOWO2_01_FULL_39_12b]